MTLHVHLSEIETAIATSCRNRWDRMMSPEDQDKLMLRLHRIYELIAVLDAITYEAQKSMNADQIKAANSRLSYIHMIVKTFFDDPSFTAMEEYDRPTPKAEVSDVKAEVLAPAEPPKPNVVQVDFRSKTKTPL